MDPERFASLILKVLASVPLLEAKYCKNIL